MTAINLRDMRIEASAMKLEARMQRKKGNGLVADRKESIARYLEQQAARMECAMRVDLGAL